MGRLINMNNNKAFFHFFDENTEMDHRIPVTCTEEQWEEWVEEDCDKDDSFIASLETEVPVVHDTDDWKLEDGTLLLGFQSYEAEDKKTLNEVLTKWKEKLIELGWVDPNDTFVQVSWKRN